MKINFTLKIKSLESLAQVKPALEMSKTPMKVKKLPGDLYSLVATSSFLDLKMEPSAGPNYTCTGTFQANEEAATKTIKTLSLALHADGIEHLIVLTDEAGKEIASCK